MVLRLDMDAVELTIKTFFNYLITKEFNFPAILYGRHMSVYVSSPRWRTSQLSKWPVVGSHLRRDLHLPHQRHEIAEQPPAGAVGGSSGSCHAERHRRTARFVCSAHPMQLPRDNLAAHRDLGLAVHPPAHAGRLQHVVWEALRTNHVGVLGQCANGVHPRRSRQVEQQPHKAPNSIPPHPRRFSPGLQAPAPCRVIR
eukprot:1195567-Prorocentrum_minimum.AAC.5